MEATGVMICAAYAVRKTCPTGSGSAAAGTRAPPAGSGVEAETRCPHCCAGAQIDKVDLFIATGLRPGELLGLLLEDVDFDSTPATIEVTGTIKRTSESGLHRQAYPKSEHGKRVLGLPGFAVKMLVRRKLAQDPDNPLGLIFPSRAGGVLDPGNFRRQWVEARGAEFSWVKPGGFRKAVATLIEREAGSVVASQQLGHSSDAVTRKHYIERNRATPDTTLILEQFGDAGSL